MSKLKLLISFKITINPFTPGDVIRSAAHIEVVITDWGKISTTDSITYHHGI